MRRRLDLAASMVGRPRVLHLDEPTTGLDPRSRNEVWGMVRRLVADGTTVLLTTQYLDEADQLAHDIAVIDRGKVIATGTPDQLKSSAGRQVLEVTPASRDDLAEVAELLGLMLATTPTVSAEAGQVAVGVEGGKALPDIIRALDDRSIELAEFALRRASLDEVFLALTGHRADAGTSPEAQQVAKGAARARELKRSPR
jgi:oleandomycin transport system ATP-binding protein